MPCWRCTGSAVRSACSPASTTSWAGAASRGTSTTCGASLRRLSTSASSLSGATPNARARRERPPMTLPASCAPSGPTRSNSTAFALPSRPCATSARSTFPGRTSSSPACRISSTKRRSLKRSRSMPVSRTLAFTASPLANPGRNPTLARTRHTNRGGLMARIKFSVDGKAVTVSAEPDMPLLYALRDDLKMTNPHFGCGLAQCGACTVHLDGEAVRSCVMPLSAVGGKKVTTLQGLGTPEKPHPLQAAYVQEQVPQCGYCINGWIMTAAAYLKKNPKASDAELRDALAGLKCRCGTHVAILRAIKRAQTQMA